MHELKIISHKEHKEIKEEFFYKKILRIKGFFFDFFVFFVAILFFALHSCCCNFI